MNALPAGVTALFRLAHRARKLSELWVDLPSRHSMGAKRVFRRSSWTSRMSCWQSFGRSLSRLCFVILPAQRGETTGFEVRDLGDPPLHQ